MSVQTNCPNTARIVDLLQLTIVRMFVIQDIIPTAMFAPCAPMKSQSTVHTQTLPKQMRVHGRAIVHIIIVMVCVLMLVLAIIPQREIITGMNVQTQSPQTVCTVVLRHLMLAHIFALVRHTMILVMIHVQRAQRDIHIIPKMERHLYPNARFNVLGAIIWQQRMMNLVPKLAMDTGRWHQL